MLPTSNNTYSINQNVRRTCTGCIADRRTISNLLCLAYFVIFCGYRLWIAGFHNYAVETFHIGALHTGYLFSAAALPGTFAFLIGILARKFSLGTLIIFACGTMGFGLIGVGLSPSAYLLWPGVLSIGLGFTCFYPIINSICIQQSDPRNVNTTIGHLKSYGPLAAVTAFMLITVCMPQMGYRRFFFIAGCFVVLIGFWAFTDIRVQQYADRLGHLRFKKHLWPYYVLNFLAGCRSAGITAFVLLLLIREHGLMMPETAAVLLIGNVFSLIGYRLIGQLANRFHPPTILSFIYLGVSITFLGFSYINSQLAMTLLLFLDSILLGASVVTDSYLKGVSRAKDTVGDIASGYTFFHLGKTIFPLVGGMLWSHFNQQATFLLLSILAVLAVWVSTKLNDPHLTGEGRLVQQVVANQMR